MRNALHLLSLLGLLWLMPISASEHRQIVKAIATGNAELAGKAMFDHVMESKVRTIENDLHRQTRAAASRATKRRSA